MKKPLKIGLLPKLLIAIVPGILMGLYMPEAVCRLIVTLSCYFSSFQKFVIPLNLRWPAGRLLPAGRVYSRG